MPCKMNTFPLGDPKQNYPNSNHVIRDKTLRIFSQMDPIKVFDPTMAQSLSSSSKRAGFNLRIRLPSTSSDESSSSSSDGFFKGLDAIDSLPLEAGVDPEGQVKAFRSVLRPIFCEINHDYDTTYFYLLLLTFSSMMLLRSREATSAFVSLFTLRALHFSNVAGPLRPSASNMSLIFCFWSFT